MIGRVILSAAHTYSSPSSLEKRVRQDPNWDIALNIIKSVPAGTSTWCSRMVVAPKKDRSTRKADLQKLNAATMRETHHTPSPFNQVSTVPDQTKKTVLNAWNWYHSLPLSQAAQDIRTSIMEWGQYRYLRAPQGFCASRDGYTHWFDDITVDTPEKPVALTIHFFGMCP